MPIGAIGIQTNPKRDNGAPFPAGSAANGVSVDPITGQIVLGNDVGGVLAALTSVREIPFGGQGISLTAGALINTLFFPGFIQVNTATANTILDENGYQVFRANPGDGPAAILLNDAVLQVLQGMDGTGVYSMQSNIAGQFGSYDVQNGRWQVGLPPGGSGSFNGAQLEVVGDLTYDISVNQTGGAIVINENTDKGRLFTNVAGASTFTLPSAPIEGFHCMFAVNTANNLTVQVAADNINIGNLQSIAGGSVSSNAIGSFLHLVYTGGANRWIAASSLGAWVVN
jgi:hypothetical protein